MCVDQAVINLQCGIAEIEFYRRGPTSSQRRALIRSEPHLKRVTPPEPIRPAGNRLLARTGHTSVDLSGTSVTTGEGSALVDENPNTLVSIKNKRLTGRK